MSALARWADLASLRERLVLPRAVYWLVAFSATPIIGAHAIPVRAQSIPAPAVELRSVAVVPGPARTCHIQPHASGADYLMVSCDNGSGTYCYETRQDNIVPEATGTAPVLERLFVCSHLGDGLQLLATTTQSWELLGARLYATGGDSRNPLYAAVRDLTPNATKELHVGIPVPGGVHHEVVRIDRGVLVPILSFEERRDVPGAPRGGDPEWNPFGAGTVVIRAGVARGVTSSSHGNGRYSYRVAHWQPSVGRFSEPVACPDPHALYDATGWTDDGRYVSLLRVRRVRLRPAEQREGLAVRYETTYINWTWTPSGCPALLMRTRAVVYRPADPAPGEERALQYAIVDLEPRSGRLRAIERDLARDDARVVEALGTGGVCGQYADCCGAVSAPTAGRASGATHCSGFRQWTSSTDTATCQSMLDGVAASLRSQGGAVPLACIPPTPQREATATSVTATPALSPAQMTPLLESAIPNSVRTYAPGCSLDVRHAFAISQPGALIDGTAVVPVFCSVELQSTTRFVQFRGSEIVHVLGDHVADNWQEPAIDAVALVDVNADGSADFIALVRAVPGVGENHSDEFTVGDFWLGTSTGDWRRDQPVRRLVEGAVTTAAAIERLRAHYASRAPTSPAPASTGGSFGGRNFGVPVPSTQGSD